MVGEFFSSVDFWSFQDEEAVLGSHRALPVCEWPDLGKSWDTARSNAASAVCSRCGGACTGCCGRAGQVVNGGCGFVDFISFPDEEALLNNHSAQSPASV